MKIRSKSINHIKQDKKMYDIMGYRYIGKGIGFFKNHKSLKNKSYGCDRYESFFKKYRHKSSRRLIHINLTKQKYEYLYSR